MQSSFLVFTDAVGIVAFALAGILAAKGRDVDPVGIFVVSFVTAFGGGIVRDVVIDNRPMYWIAHQEYVWLTMALAAVAPILIRRFEDKVLHTLFVWSDAVGLGFFAAGGTSLSVSAGLPYLPAVLMGVCTGVFGGLLRDVFLNRLPMVMSDTCHTPRRRFWARGSTSPCTRARSPRNLPRFCSRPFSSWAFA